MDDHGNSPTKKLGGTMTTDFSPGENGEPGVLQEDLLQNPWCFRQDIYLQKCGGFSTSVLHQKRRVASKNQTWRAGKCRNLTGGCPVKAPVVGDCSWS